MKGKTVVIAGGSGFIGRHLTRYLLKRGCRVTILTRDPDAIKTDSIFKQTSPVRWSPDTDNWHKAIRGVDCLINLSGRNLAKGRWNKRVRNEIRDSRVKTTRAIAAAIAAVDQKPRCVIQTSAVGYYGTQSPMNAHEMTPSGKGFLADVTRDWESAAVPLIKHPETRAIIARFGVVMGVDGGLYHRITCLVRHYMGGIVGNGKNWISWIHIADLVRVIEWMITNESAAGIYNVTAPEPVQHKDLIRTIAKNLRKPVMPAPPAAIVRVAMGAMVDELLLASQHVKPVKLLNESYRFHYRTADKALKALYMEAKTSGSLDRDCTDQIQSV
jgi:uncharacterized protein